MKRVLVTGATGFIGRHALVPLLARGYEVHAVRRVGAVSVERNVTWHTADLLNAKQVEVLFAEVCPTHLLHFAWYAVPGKYWTSEENLAWVGATFELLRAFRRHGGIRVVLAGSCAEYDWASGICSEASTSCRPASLYGVCKLATQMVLASWSRESGVSSAWGRIFFLYGPFEHPTRLVSSVICSLLKGQPARCTSGQQVRDFMHVEDVAASFVALLDGKVTGVVNIASGKPVTVKEVVQTIATQLDLVRLLEIGAIPLAESEPGMLCANNMRLRSEVGFQSRYDLMSGLKQTIKWHQTRREAISS